MKCIKNIDNLMSKAVVDAVFPGGVLLAVRGSEVIVCSAVGNTSNFPDGKKVTPETVFDLASLTKPLATTLSVMFLLSEKKIDIDASIYDSLRVSCPDDKARITWLNLLCHNSGLPDYRPWYQALFHLPDDRRKAQLYQMIADEPLVSPVGRQTVYSDIGFLLLQQGVEIITGESLGSFVHKRLYPSLFIHGLFFPSEVGHESNGIEYAATEICPFRGLLQGVVHDENAFAIGGAAGHAGLFGTAGAVHLILAKLLDAHAGKSINDRVDSKIVSRFLSVPENFERTPGFDVPAPEGSSCGNYFNKNATIGHLGFTGTSFWIDLEKKIIIILLTNRIHPNRRNEKIKKFRPFIHDEVMRAIL